MTIIGIGFELGVVIVIAIVNGFVRASVIATLVLMATVTIGNGNRSRRSHNRRTRNLNRIRRNRNGGRVPKRSRTSNGTRNSKIESAKSEY